MPKGDAMNVRRIDPEPITIYLAIVATFTASVAAANYIKTHYKPLPSAVRAGVSKSLAELEDHVKHLRADLSILKDIFAKAMFPNGRGIRLGNGAYLTADEFSRYMKTSDSVIRRLGDVNKLTLKMEREATKLPNPQDLGITNVLGSAYEELDSLLNSRDLSIDSAWERLRSIADNLETAIDELRKQLG
jgi:hypothetical protein